MTVIVKITSGENKADENVSKGFELIPIAAGMRAAFIRDDQGKGWLNVHGNDDHGEERLLMVLPVLGNAYIMDNGKTVASFSSADLPDLKQIDPLSYCDEHGAAPVGDTLKSLPDTEQYPDDITDPNDERLFNGDRTRIGDTYKTICVIMEGVSSFPEASHEHVFAMGLAAAIESYRRAKSKHKPVINLSFIGSVVCSRDTIEKLQNHFRLADSPVTLRIDSNDGDYITEYRIEGYYNRYDVDEADMLLLRNLRNQQKGLVKNMVDKIIKYYKAGVSVVPLEPATEILLGDRRQITAKLNEVLRCAEFIFISADDDVSVYGKVGPVQEELSALYTHVVIKFIA